MQHFERRHLEVTGLPVAYAQVGDGQPVVYLHGAMTTLEEGISGLGDTFAPRFQLTAFDRPGHGESGRDSTTGSAWRQAEIIHEAMTQLGLERPVIVGHSFGCAVAMALALSAPETLSGVILIAPIAFPEPRLELLMFGARAWPVTGEWLSIMAGPADALMLPSLWNGMFLPQQMTSGFRESFPFDLASGRSQLQADGQDALSMIESLSRSARTYGACQLPVHVMQGDRDVVVNPLVHGRPLAALLPRGKFTNLPGLGHMAHHFAPEAIADAVLDFGPQGALGGQVPSDAY